MTYTWVNFQLASLKKWGNKNQMDYHFVCHCNWYLKDVIYTPFSDTPTRIQWVVLEKNNITKFGTVLAPHGTWCTKTCLSLFKKWTSTFGFRKVFNFNRTRFFNVIESDEHVCIDLSERVWCCIGAWIYTDCKWYISYIQRYRCDIYP